MNHKHDHWSELNNRMHSFRADYPTVLESSVMETVDNLDWYVNWVFDQSVGDEHSCVMNTSMLEQVIHFHGKVGDIVE